MVFKLSFSFPTLCVYPPSNEKQTEPLRWLWRMLPWEYKKRPVKS